MEGNALITLKRFWAGTAVAAIVILTPIAAAADCNSCFGGCVDAFGSDNSENGYQMLSQCFNSCTDDSGYLCMGTVGG